MSIEVNDIICGSSECRSLKIQTLTRNYQWHDTSVPEIKLSGMWLEKWGFSPEQRVKVFAGNKILVITLEEMA